MKEDAHVFFDACNQIYAEWEKTIDKLRTLSLPITEPPFRILNRLISNDAIYQELQRLPIRSMSLPPTYILPMP